VSWRIVRVIWRK